MKVTKTQLRKIITEELETVMGEAGFFKRLGAELSGQRKKTSAVASNISQWMRENDLMGKFGPLGTSGTGTRSGKGWESHNDVFDWASENVPEAKALEMAVGEYGHIRRGFEDDPRVKAARDFHDIPRDAAYAASKKRQDADDLETALWKQDQSFKKHAADRESAAAAKKQKEEEMESFLRNQAADKEQSERDERSYQSDLRQYERDTARYGPQSKPVRRVRENKKVTKK